MKANTLTRDMKQDFYCVLKPFGDNGWQPRRAEGLGGGPPITRFEVAEKMSNSADDLVPLPLSNTDLQPTLGWFAGEKQRWGVGGFDSPSKKVDCHLDVGEDLLPQDQGGSQGLVHEWSENGVGDRQTDRSGQCCRHHIANLWSVRFPQFVQKRLELEGEALNLPVKLHW